MSSLHPHRLRGPAAFLLAILVAIPLSVGLASAQAKPDSSVSKAVGAIKTVQPTAITIASESGGDISATLTASTKILRVPPGEKDLKNATPLQPQDLQPGDRVLVRGQASADGHTIAALAVIVMKQADVSAQHQRETDDWQKRGVGGLVTGVDPATATITISSGGLAASHSVAVHTAKNTILRRYAPGSVKFDDAKPAPLSDIKVGDQLRARGTRSADGSELNADEIVSGSFRNIAGTITAADPAAGTITVHDLIAKASVTVKISAESQMKKLPAELAQHIAARLKGGANSDQPSSSQNANSPQSRGTNAPNPHPGAASSEANGSSGRGGPPNSQSGSQSGGQSDVQRMLSRLPSCTIADLQKGEAVMIVSTGGDNPAEVTAITLLAGVEPILTAAPTRSASLLSPWSLSASGGEGDSAP